MIITKYNEEELEVIVSNIEFRLKSSDVWRFTALTYIDNIIKLIKEGKIKEALSLLEELDAFGKKLIKEEEGRVKV